MATEMATRAQTLPVAEVTRTTTTAAVFNWRNLTIALALWAGTMLVFFAIDKYLGLSIRGVSQTPYYVLQASSWLHGRWDLVLPGPQETTDLVVLHGGLYSIFGPFPAVVMLPFVALFGPQVSDIFLTIVVSGLNVGLLYLLLEQLRANGLTQRGWRENAAWSALLYLGSIAVTLSLSGTVWRSAHIFAVACVLVSLLLALRRRYTWSAVALACGFFTRGTLVLGFPLLLFMAWHEVDGGAALPRFFASLRARRPDWGLVPWRRFAGIGAVGLGMVVVYLALNQLMFGSPLKSGYAMLIAQRNQWATHGMFSLSYVPANVVNAFFNFPHITYPTPYSYHPIIDLMNGGTGLSVFLTTPLFLLLFFVRNKRQQSGLWVALWVTVGLMVALVMLYYAGGYRMFGSRYLFDVYPYAWVLLILSNARMDWRVVTLGALGIVVNVLGADQFWSCTWMCHVLQL